MTDRKIHFLHYPDPLAKKVFEEWKNWENKKSTDFILDAF